MVGSVKSPRIVHGVHGGDPRATRSALTSDGAARVGRRCGPPWAIGPRAVMQQGSRRRRAAAAMTGLSARSDGRGERCGRGSRHRAWDRQAPQSAVILDGLMSHVTVTDPHHALSGQQLSLVSLRSARGPAYIVVALPDGRRRSLRRSSTDLAGPAGAPPIAPVILLHNGFRISVGTLLPLARHIVARLAAPVEEVTRDDHSPPIAESAPCRLSRGATAAALAEPAVRDPDAARLPARRPVAADGAEPQRGNGDLSC
jgi:hypothetical protein